MSWCKRTNIFYPLLYIIYTDPDADADDDDDDEEEEEDGDDDDGDVHHV